MLIFLEIAKICFPLGVAFLTPGAREGRVQGGVYDTIWLDWPDPLDQVDLVDPLDPLACSKVVFRVSETLLCPPRQGPGPCQTLASPKGWRSSGTSLGGPISQILSRNCINWLNLGNESMYLYLLYLMDTISYARVPGDTKNDVKTRSRSTHIKSQKQHTKITKLVTKRPSTAQFEE